MGRSNGLPMTLEITPKQRRDLIDYLNRLDINKQFGRVAIAIGAIQCLGLTVAIKRDDDGNQHIHSIYRR